MAFGRRVAEIALGVFTLLVFWNYESWIVDKNIDRAVQTGKFDLAYARLLSDDAIPTLIARRRELGPMAAQLEASVRCGSATSRRRWFEWNRSANAKQDALRSVHPDVCPAGATLHWARRVD